MESIVIRVPRWIVSLIAGLFALFHFLLGLLSLNSYANESNAILALGIYLVAVFCTTVLYRGNRLPISQALLNLAASFFIPLLVNNELDPSKLNDYSTWYVVGVGTLMAATAVRERFVIAWIGTAGLILQVIVWGGIGSFFVSGIIGATLLVAAGNAVSLGLVKASSQAEEFNAQALKTETERAVASAASRERQSRVAAALAGALPTLGLIQAKKGKLDELTRRQALLLEAALRDEIRGRNLMSQAIKEAAKVLRGRGVEVIILDEGGLDKVSISDRDRLLSQAAGAVEKVTEGRVTIRSPQGEDWLVTVAAVRPGVATPDIWLKLS
jgi:hypothetical protein